MAEVQIILLAAGQSTRMGRANKLLMKVGDVPLVRRTAEQICAVAGAEVTVVLGHAAGEVEVALAGLAVRTIVNHHHASGQMSSVHAGLSAAGAGERFMVVPADMPRLTTVDCLFLIDAHDGAGAGQVTVPVRHRDGERQRGNPVIMPASAARTVREGGINLGCRGLLDRQPELLHAYDTDRDAFFVDMDTPDAYADLLAHAAQYPTAGSERRHPEWN